MHPMTKDYQDIRRTLGELRKKYPQFHIEVKVRTKTMLRTQAMLRPMPDPNAPWRRSGVVARVRVDSPRGWKSRGGSHG